MAAIARKSKPSISSCLPGSVDQTTGLTAGEAISAFAPCYIKQSDGKVYNSTGTAANAAAEVHGYAAEDYASGDRRVTLWHGGFNADYCSTAQTAGIDVYLAVTAGTFDTATSTGGTRKLGYVLPDQGAATGTRIHLYGVQGR